ncbi:colicin E3/pyocin S6 family cytotoxin [Pontibacter sp. 13R65]|uniref:colicin E3/pyocin S6 family cytotoxin n=1 Tax=Pontibacter sp. 13R65 TaxID=3127458 RepID=UPI0039C93F98
MGGISIPRPCYLDSCIHIGAINGQKRWRSVDFQRIYTWDSLHGEIEVFNKRGRHLGVKNIHGEFIKAPVKGRKIDV